MAEHAVEILPVADQFVVVEGGTQAVNVLAIVV